MLLLDLKQYSRELSDNVQIMELIQKNDVHAENQYQSKMGAAKAQAEKELREAKVQAEK